MTLGSVSITWNSSSCPSEPRSWRPPLISSYVANVMVKSLELPWMMRFSAASAEATFFKCGYTGLVYAMLVVKSSVGMITMLLVFFYRRVEQWFITEIRLYKLLLLIIYPEPTQSKAYSLLWYWCWHSKSTSLHGYRYILIHDIIANHAVRVAVSEYAFCTYQN